ncbi:uncharacterized protein N7482_000425 [Penicillium canariense]|uniref:Uncharacterized protein n=1 Tax=Penicillium canariense TaxID=189055 RepID=A0A9W9IBE4_9EURO|nr:uncharacterized protein N7482_000425 [Penicillium canariense]KAJ5174548.1 hypothetical protein N7482_000425 [Penicillium canariense]
MDDVQTTARWANRVLRPLTSIYRRLEKHQETLAIIAADSRAQEHNTDIDTHPQDTSEVVKARDNCSGSDADENDPVWIPGKKPDQRRVRHRYSSRGDRRGGKKRSRLSIHSPEAHRTLPGAIELATPMITGKRWEAPSSACAQLSAEQIKPTNPQGQLQAFRDKYPLHKSPWQELLDQSGDTRFANIAHNLDRILQNFLCNTRITKYDVHDAPTKPGRGARSLMSMVVRRLPEFIANEQDAQDKLEEHGDEDMCDAYFTELELFYAPHGRGWKPLREAVRAQGIHLVSAMILNKWLTDPIACALIEKCRYHEPDACESLLSTFLSTRTNYHYPVALKPPADSALPGDPVQLLRKYAHYGPAHRSYIFDELSKLLIRRVLPPEWMATKLWTSWMTRATISFSKRDDDCTAASRLIEAVLVSASNVRPTATAPISKKRCPERYSMDGGRQAQPSSNSLMDQPGFSRNCPVPVEDALSNHVASLLAALCGMHISRSRELDGSEPFNGTNAGHIINYLSFALEKDVESKPQSHVVYLASHQLLRRGCILLADCLLQCNNAILGSDPQNAVGSTPGIERYCKTLASRSDLVKELALFVRQAFRCFGSTTDDERRHMGQEVRRMVSRLPRLTDATALSTLLGRVAVEAAMEFAEGTGEPDDHVWAVEVQETVISLQSLKEPSSKSAADEPEEQRQRKDCFRWEESIGEWVARTPAVKLNPVPIVMPRGRRSLTARPMAYIPCSTDSSSPESDRFEKPASSLTSSPPSGGIKRTFECTDSSPLQPAKRRRPAPVIVKNPENRGRRRSGPSSATIASKSPSLEPVPSQRRVLRDLSNRNPTNRAASTNEKPATKLEVVIFNKKKFEMKEGSIQSAPKPEPEPAEKQIYRAVERRRPGRPRIPALPTPAPRVMTRRQSTVVPCSTDGSDDELSFI